jgi:peptidoglycan/LPS O-acetylase OafA/YrhL
MVGAGYMAKLHSLSMNNLAGYTEDPTDRFDLVRIVDTDAQAAEREATRWGWSEHGTDWKTVTRDPSIDVVDIVVMGVIAYRALEFGWTRRVLGNPWFAGLIYLGTVVLMTFKHADILIVACFPLLILALQAGNNLPARIIGGQPFYGLGVISYSIYLVHNQLNYFMHDLARALTQAGLGTNSATAASIAVFASVAILIARLTYRLIEQPAMRYLRKARLSREVSVTG